MYFGTEEIKRNVKGTFQKFYYRQTIYKTKNTEKLFNFSGDRHTEIKFCYTRNYDSMCDLIDMWNKTYNDNSYKYELVKGKDLRNPHLYIQDVIDDFNEFYKFQYVISHTMVNNREVIH